MSGSNFPKAEIGVLYLARGADHGWPEKLRVFRDSYRRCRAGAEHQLYIIYKGFKDATDLKQGRAVFKDIPHHAIYIDDAGYDLGAYFAAAIRADHELLCFLNTASEIRGIDWLRKMALTLLRADVGMVGCSGSYEAPQHPGMRNVPFPNPHLRTNAFMMRRRHLLEMRPDTPLIDKASAYMLEHGINSFTRRFARQGLKTLIVGKNGRGYEPTSWVESRTFRQGTQPNLLIADNRTNDYDAAPLGEKRALFHISWGDAGTRALCELFSER